MQQSVPCVVSLIPHAKAKMIQKDDAMALERPDFVSLQCSLPACLCLHVGQPNLGSRDVLDNVSAEKETAV
jgi:hypothetical protein